MSAYKVIEVVGTSTESWEKAGMTAINVAAEHLEDLRVAEVTAHDIHLEPGKQPIFRTKLKLSFKYHEHD